MAHKPPTQKNTGDTGTEQDDAAFIDAYERRKAGGRATDVPVEWRAEVEDFVRIHQRLAAEPMPNVSPAVRSIILSAAAEATREPMQEPLFTRLLQLIMRPGPVLALMTVAALAVAVGVRMDKVPAPPELPAGAVASHVAEPSLQVPPGDRVVAAEPARGAEPTTLAPVEEPAAAPAAAVAQVDEGKPAPAGQPSAAPPKPTRVIAARPASLGPEPNAPQLAKRDMPVAGEGAAGKVAGEDKLANQDKGAKQDLAVALDAVARKTTNSAVAEQNTNRNKGSFARLETESRSDKAPAEAASQRSGKAEAAAQREQAPAAEETKPQQADSYRKAPAKDTPFAQSAPAQNAMERDVVELKAKADKTSDPEERVVVLQKLMATAKKLGHAKTEKWARDQLAAAEQAVIRNRANAQQQRAAPSQQNQPPLQKEKAGKSL